MIKTARIAHECTHKKCTISPGQMYLRKDVKQGDKHCNQFKVCFDCAEEIIEQRLVRDELEAAKNEPIIKA